MKQNAVRALLTTVGSPKLTNNPTIPIRAAGTAVTLLNAAMSRF
jgi:hypothetical protein